MYIDVGASVAAIVIGETVSGREVGKSMIMVGIVRGVVGFGVAGEHAAGAILETLSWWHGLKPPRPLDCVCGRLSETSQDKI